MAGRFAKVVWLYLDEIGNGCENKHPDAYDRSLVDDPKVLFPFKTKRPESDTPSIHFFDRKTGDRKRREEKVPVDFRTVLYCTLPRFGTTVYFGIPYEHLFPFLPALSLPQ